MPRNVINAEDAAAMSTLLAEPEPKKKQPKTKAQKAPTEPETVKFRVTNVGRVYFPDGTSFDFHKIILAVSNPDIISKLTKLTELPNAQVFILE